MTSPEDKTPAPGPESAKPAPVGAPSYEEGFSVAPITRTEANSGETKPISTPPAATPPAPLAPAVTDVQPKPLVPVEETAVQVQQTPAAATTSQASSDNPFPVRNADPVVAPIEPTTPSSAVPPPQPSHPCAWQPFTIGGVASFAYASPDRVFFMQALMALIAGFVVLWFVDRNYTPVIVAAARNMPEEAVVRNGSLDGVTTGVLAERKFLSVAIDLRQGPSIGQSADLQLELHERNIAICPSYRSLAGIILCRYPTSGYWPVGRTILEPWWDAWKPVCYAGVVLGVGVGLILTWLILATAYGIAARLIAYFGDRSLGLGQCWNLAAAALMPGALIMILGIVFYGLQMVDLIGLSMLSVLHFIVGWVYLAFAPLRAPRNADATPATNPFGS